MFDPKGNLALMKRATQHGTLYGHGPELAVDGDRDLNANNGGCAKPYSYDPSVYSPGDPIQGAWWMVDLASSDPNERFFVIKITILNSQNAEHQGRLLSNSWTLDEGSPLSHVDFKK